MRHVIVSLARGTASELNAAMEALVGRAAVCEIRLDLCDALELEHLRVPPGIAWLATCRPAREGGAFRGTEAERFERLRAAVEHGASVIDIEWDSVTALGSVAAKTIVSRHWFEEMPSDLRAHYDELRPHGDIVKLVGTPASLGEVIPVFDVLTTATSPVIAMAMGTAGPLTRLLAPCFPACAYIYVAYGIPTAPGQLSLENVERVWDGREPHQIETIELVRPKLAGAAPDASGAANVLRVPLPPLADCTDAVLGALSSRLPRPVRLV